MPMTHFFQGIHRLTDSISIFCSRRSGDRVRSRNGDDARVVSKSSLKSAWIKTTVPWKPQGSPENHDRPRQVFGNRAFRIPDSGHGNGSGVLSL